MALTDFFRINLPYGMERNEKGEWFVFNREYKPLGWNTDKRVPYGDYPVYVKYKGLTEAKIKKLAPSENQIRRDESGSIVQFWLYNDATNPHDYPKYWEAYLEKIKLLAKLKPD